MIPTGEKTSEREFDHLFAPFRTRVIGYLCRLTGSQAEAEDLTQETLLAAYHQRSRFRLGTSPLAYLMGIARRRWRDSRRTLHPSVPLEDQIPQASPQSLWIDALTLRAALEQLPEAERRAVELTAINGHTYKEAAALTGEPVGTVKWRVYSAMRALRVLLEEKEVHPDE